jgi:mannose-1-phosphate guanylyltransferase
MKAFILAAGHGTRLKPLTDTVPKCLLPIQGVPILGIWLDLCRKYGISEVLVNTHAHSATIKRYLEKNSRGLDVCVTEEATLLGSAGTLLANRSWVASEEFFWVFYGDVLTNADLARMLKFHREHGLLATVGVYEVPNPQDCGIVTVDQRGIVCEFVEKPLKPSSNLAFSGLLIATPSVLDLIPRQTPADIGFDLLPKLVGRTAAYPIADPLLDIGTPETYRAAQHCWPELRSTFPQAPEAC